MKDYFSNRIFTSGFVLLILGNAPLLAILFLARIGVWPDPDPNPIGPGLLSFATFWPAIILIAVGISKV